MARKLNYENFESISQMLSVINGRKNNSAMSGCMSSERNGKSFTGTNSYKEAVDLITNGWEEPLDKMKKATAKNIKTNVARQKSLPSTGIVGYAPCVPNAILGVPNSMITTDRIPSKVKAITLTYAISVNCGWSESQITKCGITALNIVNDLELDGYRVGLNVEFMAANSDKETSIATVKVKDWRQPMDIKKLAFPIVNPSMFRRFGFKWLETCPQVTDYGYSGGYGIPISHGSYEAHLKAYRDNGVLKDKEYMISAAMIDDEHYEKDRILKKAGIVLK